MLDPERLFGRFDILDRPALIVAISGGSDSTALLLLLHDYLSRHGRADRLHAVTVDHALRLESADEAKLVADLCSAHGVRHRTMRWSDPKPATGLSAAARTARYRLLATAADAVGAAIILTGHTADDQAETAAMRAMRGSGIGLAGMAPDTLLDNRLWLLRPLLDSSRSDLRDHLRKDGVGWIDDPSNENPLSERVRTRQRLTDVERGALAEQVARAAAERSALAQRAAQVLAAGVSLDDDAVRLTAAFTHNADRDAAIHALRLVLAVAGQGEHLPDQARSEVLYEGLARPGFSASLAGCVATHRRAGITIRRERRGGRDGDGVPLTRMFRDKPLRPIIPGFDLAAYAALTNAFSAPAMPASPLCGHKAAFP